MQTEVKKEQKFDD